MIRTIQHGTVLTQGNLLSIETCPTRRKENGWELEHVEIGLLATGAGAHRGYLVPSFRADETYLGRSAIGSPAYEVDGRTEYRRPDGEDRHMTDQTQSVVKPLDEEDLIDTLEEVISETHDLDVTDRNYAINVVRFFKRNPQFLSALTGPVIPVAEAQAMVAAALEQAARDIDTLGDSTVTEALGQQLCCGGQMCGCQGADVGAYLMHHIRALIPDEARQHLDAYVAAAVAEAVKAEREACFDAVGNIPCKIGDINHYWAAQKVIRARSEAGQ